MHKNAAWLLWITSLLLNIVTLSFNNNVPPSNESMYPCLSWRPWDDRLKVVTLVNRLCPPSAWQCKPYTSTRKKETIFWFSWTTLPHPPYSPDLVPTDYYFFSPMKEGLWGKYYASDEQVKTAAMKSLKEQSTEFYSTETHPLIQRWNIAIETNNDNVEK